MKVRGVTSMAGRGAALLLAAGVLVSGCTATEAAPGDTQSSAPSATTSQTPEPKPISMKVSPKRGAEDVEPGRTIEVTADSGTLTKVVLRNPDGEKVKGSRSADKTSWQSGEPLGYGKEYKLVARGVGEDGEESVKRSTFTTALPAGQVSVTTTVAEGATVGVGMPISFRFSAPIADKKAAERALQITPNKEVDGGFYWFSDQWVVWRPKEYWEPGTRVDIKAMIYGRDLGNGVYGVADVTTSMKVGKKVVAVADGKSHKMKVRINDKHAKTLKTSMGRPGHNTPHGTYTVMSEHNGYTLDSSTYGVPSDSAEGYAITVDTAVRLSYSGIFYHSAPWSVYDQGKRNVSHGCINLSPEDARWLMEQTKPGDIVEVRRSGGPELEPTDGWSVWQLSWKEWRTGGKG